MAITGCVVVFVLIAIYASVWFMMVSVRKDDFHIGYYYGEWGISGYYLDQEAADVYSTYQSNGDRTKWETALSQKDSERIYSSFWVPMERVHQLLFGLKTVLPSHYIENRDELFQRQKHLHKKSWPSVP